MKEQEQTTTVSLLVIALAAITGKLQDERWKVSRLLAYLSIQQKEAFSHFSGDTVSWFCDGLKCFPHNYLQHGAGTSQGISKYQKPAFLMNYTANFSSRSQLLTSCNYTKIIFDSHRKKWRLWIRNSIEIKHRNDVTTNHTILLSVQWWNYMGYFWGFNC